MSFRYLSTIVLQEIGACTVEYTFRALGQTGRVSRLISTGFNSGKFDFFVVRKRIKSPHGIASTADAGHKMIRLTAPFFSYLVFDFVSDHSLEVPDYHRVGEG